MRKLLTIACLLAVYLPVDGARSENLNASELAARLGAAVEDGEATTRARMKIPSGGVLQLQIKSRRARGQSAVSYEILWPAERKGETVLLRQTAGRGVEGWSKAPSGESTPIDRARMAEGLFGSDLSYEDAIVNFYRWGRQSLAGTEKIGAAECAILESRPGPKDVTAYGWVRSWVDVRRLVPLRVEKYDRAGRLVRRIDARQVAKDDTGRQVPAALSVQQAGRGTVTEIEGANIRHDVRHAEEDFAP